MCVQNLQNIQVIVVENQRQKFNQSKQRSRANTQSKLQYNLSKRHFEVPLQKELQFVVRQTEHNRTDDIIGNQQTGLEKMSKKLQNKNNDMQTIGESIDGSMPMPYQFLAQRNPTISSIFFPRFQIKSITFSITMLYLILFIILLIRNYTRIQNDFSWNCTIYQLQNKYFPKLRRDNQIWRVLISGFFHSNVAHFILNVFGFQFYGYFVQWHYGKFKYIFTISMSLIGSHFLACLINKTSLSTTSSAVLYSIIALKICFLYEYRDYIKLKGKKKMLIGLLVIMTVSNLVPIFVVNNVDYATHLGGFICGGLLGIFFQLHKLDQLSILKKIIKWSSFILLLCFMLSVTVLAFTIQIPDISYLCDSIDQMCNF